MGLPFAKELRRRGHHIQVLTGFPNYPGGKIYHGYKIKARMTEVMDGIPIIRVPLYPSHDHSTIKRIITYVTFALSASVIGTFSVDKADVAYVTQGPATIGYPAEIIKLIRRIPFVYDIKDLWPDSLTATGMFDSRFGMKLANAWCKMTYKWAEKITVCTPGYKKTLIERGVPAQKIEVIYNWCDRHIVTLPRDEDLMAALRLENKFIITYAGNIGKAQAMEVVIKAAETLKGMIPAVCFLMVGSGVDYKSLKQTAEQKKLDNVRFLGRKPVDQIASYLSISDALLVHLKNTPLFKITIPGKTEAYLAAGKPILTGVGGDANDIVEKANAGIAFESENAEGLVEAVATLFNMSPEQRRQMGENGSRFYQENVSFEIGVDKFEKVFNALYNKKGKE